MDSKKLSRGDSERAGNHWRHEADGLQPICLGWGNRKQNRVPHLRIANTWSCARKAHASM